MAFDAIDANRDGVVTREEFDAAVQTRTIEMQPSLVQMPPITTTPVVHTATPLSYPMALVQRAMPISPQVNNALLGNMMPPEYLVSPDIMVAPPIYIEAGQTVAEAIANAEHDSTPVPSMVYPTMSSTGVSQYPMRSEVVIAPPVYVDAKPDEAVAPSGEVVSATAPVPLQTASSMLVYPSQMQYTYPTFQVPAYQQGLAAPGPISVPTLVPEEVHADSALSEKSSKKNLKKSAATKKKGCC